MKLKRFKFWLRNGTHERYVLVDSKTLNGAVRKLFQEIDTNEEQVLYFEEI